MPMDPALRSILARLFSEANESVERVLLRLVDGTINLQTHARRFVERAGFTPWPKPMHNLRASCETDWCEEHPMHVVAAWLGYSPRVAVEHYFQIPDSHFEKAAGLEGGVKSDAGVASKPVSHSSAPKCTDARSKSQTTRGPRLVRQGAVECAGVQSKGIAPPGFEPGTKRL